MRPNDDFISISNIWKRACDYYEHDKINELFIYEKKDIYIPW